jgi:hypothetical protein
MKDPIRLMDDLYWICEDRVGMTILWNACYHIEVKTGEFRFPSYNQEWHSDRWWNID